MNILAEVMTATILSLAAIVGLAISLKVPKGVPQELTLRWSVLCIRNAATILLLVSLLVGGSTFVSCAERIMAADGASRVEVGK